MRLSKLNSRRGILLVPLLVLNTRENVTILAFNRNKKSLILDLWTETGKEAFYDLVKISDVVRNNFRPRVMVGMDYEILKKINPSLRTEIAIADWAAGMFAALGVASALAYRAMTGKRAENRSFPA